jgi:hypothetical protein
VINVQVGAVQVETTSGRSAGPEEVADRCLSKLLYVAEDVAEPIKQQVYAFRGQIRELLVDHIEQAVKNDRADLQNKLSAAGQKDLAEIIRRL